MPKKRIGSSLEAAPIVYIGLPDGQKLLTGIDFAEVCITSEITLKFYDGLGLPDEVSPRCI